MGEESYTEEIHVTRGPHTAENIWGAEGHTYFVKKRELPPRVAYTPRQWRQPLS